MAKKERNFHGEADFLRHQLRALAAETGTVIKDTNFMKKEECKEEIAALNRVKYKKELEAETRANIEKLKRELSDKDNQITNLQKEKLGLEKELAGRNRKITEIELEKLELEKEIERKNEEIAELKAERTASQITMKKLEEKIKQSEERTQKSLDSKNDFIDKLQEELNQLKNRKWYQFWK